MDILEIYGKIKKAGNIKLERFAEGVFTATIQQFDPHTGKALPPQVANFQRDAVQVERDKIARRLSSLDEMLADIDATPEK